jgi:hypothetical protein
MLLRINRIPGATPGPNGIGEVNRLGMAGVSGHTKAGQCPTM